MEYIGEAGDVRKIQVRFDERLVSTAAGLI
jgi:hypothetical protein